MSQLRFPLDPEEEERDCAARIATDLPASLDFAIVWLDETLGMAGPENRRIPERESLARTRWRAARGSAGPAGIGRIRTYTPLMGGAAIWKRM